MQDITLIVKPTHKCNLNCYYCYDKKNRDMKKEMNEDIVEKTIEIFENDVGEWIWHGGEPLLMGKEYFERCNDIIQEYRPELNIQMQTNGTLINDEIINMFKKYDIQPGMSFDGIRNEFTRKNTGVFMRKLSLLDKHDVNYGVIMVITPDSVENLIGEYEYFKRLDLRVQMNMMFKADKNDESCELDNMKTVKGVTKFFDYWIRDTNNPKPNSLCLEYINRLLDSGRIFCNRKNCVGKWFGIHPNGDIYPCGRDWDKDMCFGNIMNMESITDIFENENFIRYKKGVEKILEKCKNCPFYDVCHGGCYGTIYSNYKEFKVPKNLHCVKFKKIMFHVFNRVKNINIYEEDLTEYNPYFLESLMKTGFRNKNLSESLNKSVKNILTEDKKVSIKL